MKQPNRLPDRILRYPPFTAEWWYNQGDGAIVRLTGPKAHPEGGMRSYADVFHVFPVLIFDKQNLIDVVANNIKQRAITADNRVLPISNRDPHSYALEAAPILVG